jgi:hypothetical protein
MNNPRLIIDTIIQDLISKRGLVFSKISKALIPSEDDGDVSIGKAIDIIDSYIEQAAIIDIKLAVASGIRSQLEQPNEPDKEMDQSQES